MSKRVRYRKVWWFQLILAGLIVWLARDVLIEKGKTLGIAYARAGQGQGDRKAVVIDRPPSRFIKDPNPSFSAVAVDSDANMLVVADENLFQVMEYDRRDSTRLRWHRCFLRIPTAASLRFHPPPP